MGEVQGGAAAVMVRLLARRHRHSTNGEAEGQAGAALVAVGVVLDVLGAVELYLPIQVLLCRVTS